MMLPIKRHTDNAERFKNDIAVLFLIVIEFMIICFYD